MRFPRTRVRDLCASAVECHRLGHLAGADVFAAAAAVLVYRYLERRDSDCRPIRVGDVVHVEWMPGEVWRDGILLELSGSSATVRLPTGWHVHAPAASLRRTGESK